MNYKSPFTLWWDANITQMAVSPDIRRLIAMAFEGGQISAREETFKKCEKIVKGYIGTEPILEDLRKAQEK
jgi:hypothetical protein